MTFLSATDTASSPAPLYQDGIKYFHLKILASLPDLEDFPIVTHCLASLFFKGTLLSHEVKKEKSASSFLSGYE
jgi:hypothetical protein